MREGSVWTCLSSWCSALLLRLLVSGRPGYPCNRVPGHGQLPHGVGGCTNARLEVFLTPPMIHGQCARPLSAWPDVCKTGCINFAALSALACCRPATRNLIPAALLWSCRRAQRRQCCVQHSKGNCHADRQGSLLEPRRPDCSRGRDRAAGSRIIYLALGGGTGASRWPGIRPPHCSQEAGRLGRASG